MSPNNFLIAFVSVLLLICSVESFIIEGKKGMKKCFTSEHSPDKTLEAKFGFPRREKENCAVLFSVDLIENNNKNNIYSDVHKCHEMNIGKPIVVKHTSETYSSDGFYKICVSVMDDKNEQLLMELFIGEKLNPIMYSSSDENLPLIQATELIDLDLKVQSIRKSLGWTRKLLEENTQLGDKTEAQIAQLEDFAYTATLIQILFLLAYAGFWVYFIKNQRDNR